MVLPFGGYRTAAQHALFVDVMDQF